MARPTSTSLALLVLLVPLALAAGACGGSPEQQLLGNYFRAARMSDNTTLANIATVEFSPTKQGIVESFDVVEMQPEERRPLRLRELAAAEAKAKEGEEEFNKQKREFQDANLQAIERVLKAEREGAKLRGRDLDIQAAWAKWRDDTSEHVKQVGEARRALAAERRIADSSIYDARNPIDATQFDGDLITRHMVIKARVRKPEAEAADETLHVRMERVELRNGPEGRSANGRWIITQIAPVGGGSPTS
jgi:hypothetical protein